ncbi:MAG: alpha/beta fold hydrolase [Planctomycetota bacterium]|nr:alpha/beta fold hydrolase [Planctomycetota bacterium]
MTAATELAENLEFVKPENPLILGLVNGGVIIAEIVARHLNAPLDVMLIEKLPAPNPPHHIVGVVDEHGRISMIESTARWHHLTSQQMVEPARKVFEALQKKRIRIREILPEIEVRGRTVVLVDEGIDTGARMLGAIASVRDRGARKVVVAAPAGASRATWHLRDTSDAVVIPHRPNKYKGIAHFYQSFPPISDESVLSLIERHIAERPEHKPAGVKTIHFGVTNSAGFDLSCDLDLPGGLTGNDPPVPAVIFAHGFDSNAISPRTVPISRRLAKRGIAGVRMDFTGHGRSGGDLDQATDAQMLDDLICVMKRIATLKEIDHHRLGLVGSGSGALIALQFASHEPLLGSLVLRGPLIGDERDLARLVRTPTLMIHAEGDTALEEGVDILDTHLTASHVCMRIPNSNRLFNDPISLELMINATVEWMVDHLRNPTMFRAELPPPVEPEPEVEPASESVADETVKSDPDDLDFDFDD